MNVSNDADSGRREQSRQAAYMRRQQQSSALREGTRRQRSYAWVWIVLALILLVASGTYFAYARIQAHEMARSFMRATTNLRHDLTKTGLRPGHDEVYRAVLDYANMAKCRIDESTFQIVFLPLRGNENKLSKDEREIVVRARRLPPHKPKPRWISGYKGEVTATFGLLTHRFPVEQYVWLYEIAEKSVPKEMREQVIAQEDDEAEHEVSETPQTISDILDR